MKDDNFTNRFIEMTNNMVKAALKTGTVDERQPPTVIGEMADMMDNGSGEAVIEHLTANLHIALRLGHKFGLTRKTLHKTVDVGMDHFEKVDKTIFDEAKK